MAIANIQLVSLEESLFKVNGLFCRESTSLIFGKFDVFIFKAANHGKQESATLKIDVLVGTLASYLLPCGLIKIYGNFIHIKIFSLRERRTFCLIDVYFMYSATHP